MVMVLLFLGVVFLPVGFQAMGLGTTPATTTRPWRPPFPPPPRPRRRRRLRPPRPEVRIYNISDVAGAAEGVATRLREADWNVADTGNLTLDGVTATTVYFGEAAGEREAADEVGKLLEAPVEPRTPALTDQPPGVIVAVTG